MQPKIYISYSWSPESLLIADAIDTDWQNLGITLIRDKRDINFTQSLRAFMEGMKHGDYVLLIISESYLKSKNCMYEALELFQEPTFKDKILPIIDSSAKIYNATGRLKYIKYWQDKIAELNKELRELDDISNIQGIAEELNHYTKIRASIASFSDVLSDMKSASWPDIKHNRYDDIFKYIGYKDGEMFTEGLRIFEIEDEIEQDLASYEFSVKYPNSRLSMRLEIVIAERAKKFKKQRLLLERFVAIYPGIENVSLAYLLETEFHEYDLARKNYEIAINKNRFEIYAYKHLSALLINHFHDYELARKHLERYLGMEPDDALAHVSLGIILNVNFNENKMARYHFEQSIEIAPDYVYAYRLLGILLTSKFAEHQLAREHFERAVLLEPDYYENHYNLGVLLSINFKEYASARDHFEKSIILNPSHSDSYSALAKLFYIVFEDFKSAREYYEKSIELDPNNFTAHSNLGVFFGDHLNEYQLARKQFEQALAIKPNYDKANWGLAYLFAIHLTQEKELGREYYIKAVTLNPSLRDITLDELYSL